MAGHLRRIDKGYRVSLGLPVFPCSTSPLATSMSAKAAQFGDPSDLPGKRIGMYAGSPAARSGTGRFWVYRCAALKPRMGGSATSIRRRAPTHSMCLPQ